MDRNPRGSSAIAIVGIAFRFPARLHTLDELWEVLTKGSDVTGPLPDARRALLGDRCALAEFAGGYLEGIERFDAPFFGMNGREARLCDPQQRILLETTWHALEDAAIVPDSLRGSATGVFVGAHTCDYQPLALAAGVEADAYWNAGLNTSMLANRISYTFDLAGPSFTVNTACSSGLEALVLGTSMLREGRCETAIVGGVNVILAAEIAQSAKRAGMLSPEGRCRPFDDGADGFVRGEGVAVAVLRPLEQALADGAPIHGVIRAAVSAHGGRGASLVSPQLDRQSDLIVAAHRQRGDDAAFVQVVDAHGTGTSLGDAVELDAIAQALRLIEPDRSAPVSVSSVKGNLGHLESVAGLAGVVRILAAFRREELSPTAHFERCNRLARIGDTPLRIQDRIEAWPAVDGIRTAGVSSFGFGGSIAHVILDSSPATSPRTPEHGRKRCLVLLSARDQDRLIALAASWLDWIKSSALSEEFDRDLLQDLAWTSVHGRARLPHRAGFVVSAGEELRQGLKELIATRGSASNLETPWLWNQPALEGSDQEDVESEREQVMSWLEDPTNLELPTSISSGQLTHQLPRYSFSPLEYWLGR